MSPSAGISPLLVREASSIVLRRTGLVFSDSRGGILQEGLARGLRRSGLPSAAEYVARLATETKLLEDLVPRITVGETYFFRDWAQLALIRDSILPELDRRPRASRVLRVWSAGCSTGEEAYSLAICMREWGRAAEVVGTDISRPALSAARKASYSAWSLRCTPELLAKRYFRHARGRFHLDPALRDAVRFDQLNLAECAFPSPALGIMDMDIVLCRNVLLYFERAMVDRVTARLAETLAPGGWLILGATDPTARDVHGCEPLMTESGRLYRRSTGGDAEQGAGGAVARRQPLGMSRTVPVLASSASGPAAPPVANRPGFPAPADSPRASPAAPPPVVNRAAFAAPLDSPPASPPARRKTSGGDADPGSAEVANAAESATASVRQLYRTGRYEETATLAEKHLAAGRDDRLLWIMLVRARANEGILPAAEEASARALARHPLCAELAYLQAVLKSTANDDRGAALAYRRALYLDRSLIVAHVGLGQLLMRAGRPEAARRALAAAEALLAPMRRDEMVRGADGETAGSLLALTRQHARLVHG